MSERRKQTAFLKKLLDKEDTEQRRRLQEELFKAEENEKCVRSAMSAVALIGLLSLCGLCYEAVLLRDFFRNPSYVLTRLFLYLALGSGIGWVVFLAFWSWYRALTNRLYEHCRRLLVSLSETRVSIHPPKECLTIGHDSVPEHDTTIVARATAAPLSKAV